MKHVIRISAVVASLAFAVPSLAQEARPTVGIGVSIVPLEVGGAAPTVEVYLPVRIAPNFRIEPSLGIRSVDRPSTSAAPDERDITLGIGVFALQRVAQPLDLYFGGRLKLNFARVESQAGVSNSGTDVVLAAAIGAEDYLSPRFSIGLEGQIGWYSNSSAAIEPDADGFFTTGLAFLRFYF